MLTVKSIGIEKLDQAGCNNGNYPAYTIELSDGIIISGLTCRCQSGCSNTDKLPPINSKFNDLDDLMRYMKEC